MNNRKLGIIFILSMFIMGYFFVYDFADLYNSRINLYEEKEKKVDIKLSGTYENITIDNLPGSWNNWEWAESKAWCSGSGTLQNPYIIQGHIFGVDNVFDGIRISNSHDIYFKIENCTFIWDGFISTGMERGILLDNSTDGFIINNTVHGISNGVNLNNCEDILFKNNTIYNTMGGLFVFQTNSSEIVNNIIYSTENGINSYNSEDNLINNNTIYSNEYGLYITYSERNNIHGNSANDNNIAGVYLAYSDNNNITENKASGNIDGIFLEDDCDNNILSKNVLNNNNYGIELYYSDFNEILENTANNNNYYGITLENSINNTILRNLAQNNTQIGIRLVETSIYNTLSGNIIYNNQEGIFIYVGLNNTIIGNTVDNNAVRGIHIDEDSDFNIFTENIISNNPIGLNIASLNDNNLVYNNFFLNNGIHAYDGGTDNKWNSTTIGNYWDNHTSPDISPQDGIVDAPYTYISGPAGSIDYLPIAEDGAPRITIISPLEGEKFGSTAPPLLFEVIDLYIVEMWYTLDGGLNNYTFTTNGTINQIVWDTLPEGSVTIIFYARDIAGNVAFEEVTVTKEFGLSPGILAIIVAVSFVGGMAIIGAILGILLKKGKISLEKLKKFSFTGKKLIEIT